MRLSASRLSLLRACQWWARDGAEWDPQTYSEPADTGKLVHELVELSASGFTGAANDIDRTIAYPKADVTRAGKILKRWREFWPSYSTGRTWLHERAYCYDIATGVARAMPREWVLGKRERGPTEIPVIIDMHTADGAEAHDLKTGKHKAEPAAENPQMLIAAVVLQKLHARASVRVGLLYANTRHVTPDVADVDALGILEFEDEVRTLSGRVASALPVPGDHCFRCPMKGNCQARNVVGLGDPPEWMAAGE